MRIIAISPTRISLACGGTDVDPYRKRFGGVAISMAINLYQHVEIFTGEDMWSRGANKFPLNADPQLFYKIFKIYGVNGRHAIRVLSSFDGIVNGGLGSSASSAVCLIGALRKLKGLPIDRYKIAEEAFDIEVNKMGWHGGRQDQYAAAFGGLNLITFEKKINITQIEREKAKELEKWMILFFVGIREIGSKKRTSSDIQKGFKKLTKKQKLTLDSIKQKTWEALGYILRRDITKLGHLMDEVWQLKKQSNKGISNAKVDAIYDYAMKNGALGGKLLGAGGGGYMVFIVNPNKREKLVSKMARRGIEDIDFSVDYNGLDVRIL